MYLKNVCAVRMRALLRLAAVGACLLVTAFFALAFAAPAAHKRAAASTRATTGAAKKSSATVQVPRLTRTTVLRFSKNSALQTRVRQQRVVRARRYYSPWNVPTYANSAEGDLFEGDDPVVRQAAIQALAGLNGTVVVAEAETGRVLTIVNQKLAFRDGFIPCSTVKVPVALAALSEAIVERDTRVRLGRYSTIDMTQALAKSNNEYFAGLGRKLGFERVNHYARLFGMGEKAGWNIEGERAGILPSAPPASGMGMMTSFGEGIALTPLELTAFVGSVANGGTLYYLQYPRNPQEIEQFVPRIKRRLEIAALIPEIKPGMQGAVEYGTARVIGYGGGNTDDSIFGKTGTCTDDRSPTHMGWFGSFKETGQGNIVTVVMLTGGRGVSGPAAAGVAGNFYKNLTASGYFTEEPPSEGTIIPGFPATRSLLPLR